MEKKCDNYLSSIEPLGQMNLSLQQNNQWANNYQFYRQINDKFCQFSTSKENHENQTPKSSILVMRNARQQKILRNQHRKIKMHKSSVTPLCKLKNLSFANILLIFSKVVKESMLEGIKGYAPQFMLHQWFINSGDQIQFVGKIKLKSQPKIIKQSDATEKILYSLKFLCGDKNIEDFVAFFNRAKSKYSCDFKFTISLIENYCLCSKVFKSNKIEILNQQKEKKQSIAQSKIRKNNFFKSQTGSREKIRSLNKNDQKTNQKSTRILKSLQKGSKTKQSSKNKAYFKQIFSQYNTQRNVEKGKTGENTFSNKISSTKDGKSSQNSNGLSSTTLSFLNKYKCIKSCTFKQENKKEKGSNCLNPNVTFKSSNEVREKIAENSQHSRTAERKYQEQIFDNNNWKVNCQNLSFNGKELLQSFVDGKQQLSPFQINKNPENLGRLARIVVQSSLPGQNNE